MAVKMYLIDHDKLKFDAQSMNVDLKEKDGLSMSNRLEREGIPHSAIYQTMEVFNRNKTLYDLEEYEGYGKVKNYGLCGLIRLKFICSIFGLNADDYILKKIEKNVPEPEVVKSASSSSIDLSELNARIEALEVAISKLGNIEMQMLEYMKTTMDYTQTCASNLKQMNEKYNKPSAYIKK